MTSSRNSAAKSSPRSVGDQENLSASKPVSIDQPTQNQTWTQPPPLPTVDGAKWTFLTNHAHVLILLAAHPDVVLREVALRVGITERAVQRIIADLEEGGCIERQKIGRRNRYRIHVTQPLRHPIESHRTIGALLNLITGKSTPE